MTEKVALSGMPFPPSSNSQYVSFVRNNRIVHAASKELTVYKRVRNNRIVHAASKELTVYKRDIASWSLINHREILDACKAIREWLASNDGLYVTSLFVFQRSRIFTKDGRLKKVDVSNRIKAHHDALARTLGVDDSYFVKETSLKAVGDRDQVFVEIGPCEILRMG